MLDTARMILIQQISTFAIAAILVFGGPYRWVLFILYLVLVTGASILLVKRKGVSIDEILNARIIYKEDDVREIMLKDEKLADEMKYHAKSLYLNLASLAVAFIIFTIAGMFHASLVLTLRQYISNLYITEYIYWVIVLEIIVLTNMTLRRFFIPSVQLPLMPARFIITERGIAIPGIMGFGIKFPLENVELSINHERKFVEIRGKNLYVRLYTSNPQRVYDLIMRFSKRAKKTSS